MYYKKIDSLPEVGLLVQVVPWRMLPVEEAPVAARILVEVLVAAHIPVEVAAEYFEHR